MQNWFRRTDFPLGRDHDFLLWSEFYPRRGFPFENYRQKSNRRPKVHHFPDEREHSFTHKYPTRYGSQYGNNEIFLLLGDACQDKKVNVTISGITTESGADWVSLMSDVD